MASDPENIVLSVTLPERLKRYVDTKVSAGAYGSASEFVGEAIREKVQRDEAKGELAGKLIAGLDSGEGIEYTDQHFEQKKALLLQRMRSRNGGA